MQYVMVTDETIEQARRDLRRSRFLAFDIETQGLNPYTDEILLYQWKGEYGPTYMMLPHRYPERENYADIIMTDGFFEGKVVIIHNAAFEYMFMNTPARRHYTDFLRARGFFDTALAEKVLTNGIITAGADLGAVVKKYCGVQLPKELQKSWIGMHPLDIPTDAQLNYAALDVEYLHDVMKSQLAKAHSEGLMRTLRLEMQCLPAFAEMQLNGFYLNLDRHSEVLQGYVVQESRARREATEALQPLYEKAMVRVNEERAAHYLVHEGVVQGFLEAHGLTRAKKDTPQEVKDQLVALRKERDKWKPKKVEAINLGSSDQVLLALNEAGLFPVAEEFDGSVKPSLDKNVLREWQHEPLVKLYTAWSKPNKVVTTYGETLREKVNPITGRVHSRYNQIINSGRCSSSDPNGQNMPPAIRACFEAQQGHTLIVADAANQEGRLAAALSGDKNMLAVFLEGIDWHSMTAAAAYPGKYKTWQDVKKDVPGEGKEDRASAKNANFSSIYGGGAHTLYNRGYVQDLATGERLMEAVYTAFPVLRNWSLAIADAALTQGYARTVIGRKRYFHLGPKPRFNPEDTTEFEKWKRRRGGIRRSAMNHPVQGSGADVMKQAMIRLHEHMESIKGKLVAFVHDELVYEVPLTHAEEVARLVEHEMKQAAACFVKALPIPGEVKITKTWSK